MFKVYCHTAAGGEGDERCVVVKFPSAEEAHAATPEDVVRMFCKAYNRRFKNDAIAIGERHSVELDMCPPEFTHRCDVNVSVSALGPADNHAEKSQAPQTPSLEASASSMQTQGENIDKSKSNAKKKKKKKKKKKRIEAKPFESQDSTSTIKHPAMVEPLIRGADQQLAAKQYRRARLAYENVLAIDPVCVPALNGLAQVAAKNAKHDVVVDTILGSRLPKSRRPSDVTNLDTFGWADGDDVLLELLGDALFGLGHLKSSLRAYDEAVQVSLKNSGSPESAKVLKLQDPRKIKMAEVLYAGGQIGSAITVIQDVLSRGENDHPEALAAYARAAADQDKRKAAIEVTMKALVLRTDDKKIREQLASLVRGPENVGLLLSIFKHATPGSKAAEGTASALAFLATVVKDYGCVDECITIYERATSLAPASASYALNLMHAYELKLEYGKCLEHALIFAEANSDMRVGRAPDKGSESSCEASCGTLAGILRSVGTFSAGKLEYLKHPRGPKTADVNSQGAASGEASSSKQQDLRVIWDPEEHPGAVVIASTATGAEVEAARDLGISRARVSASSASKFSEEDLDLLAVFFTVAKVCFISGLTGGSAMAELVSAVETVRRGRELHTTTVRNEHAYYCCIAQLMSVSDPLSPRNKRGNSGATTAADVDLNGGTISKPLVVCGDSHSLTSAWRWISVNNERRQIHPALVTGLKAWHLRDESVFYPKINFENTVACIPDGSEVIFLFCEIDCREGILMAVEKDRYDNVDAGILRSVGIYIRTLLNLVRTRNFTVYVHPVPPVLDATRGMVLRFNEVLRGEVRKTEGILKWLDFAGDLVQSDAKVPGKFSLKNGLELDGTHMSPAYLNYLARELGRWSDGREE